MSIWYDFNLLMKSHSLSFKVLITQSCLTLCGLHGLEPARLLCPWDSPGRNTGVGCHSLLQETFPTQGLNSGHPHYRQILFFFFTGRFFTVWATREVLFTGGQINLFSKPSLPYFILHISFSFFFFFLASMLTARASKVSLVSQITSVTGVESGHSSESTKS